MGSTSIAHIGLGYYFKMKLVMSVLLLIGIPVIVGTSAINAAAPCFFGHYEYSAYTATTETFTVDGNTYGRIFAYSIPDNDTEITFLKVNAASNGTVTIANTGRYFVVYFSGASKGTLGRSLTGLQSPWNNHSGKTVQSLGWNVTDTGYDVAGTGRIKVSGAGTIGTWANNQRTLISVSIVGTKRTWVPCDAAETSTSTLEPETTTTSTMPIRTKNQTLAPVVAAPILTTSGSTTAKTIAAVAKLSGPSSSKISLEVLPISTRYCKVSGTTLKGLKAGSCKVTVTVTPKKGRATSKTVTLKVTK